MLLVCLLPVALMVPPYVPPSPLQSSTLPIFSRSRLQAISASLGIALGKRGRSYRGIAGAVVNFATALEDLAYTDNASVAREWCGSFKSVFNNAVVIVGNHDSGETNYGPMDVYNRNVPCPHQG